MIRWSRRRWRRYAIWGLGRRSTEITLTTVRPLCLVWCNILGCCRRLLLSVSISHGVHNYPPIRSQSNTNRIRTMGAARTYSVETSTTCRLPTRWRRFVSSNWTVAPRSTMSSNARVSGPTERPLEVASLTLTMAVATAMTMVVAWYARGRTGTLTGSMGTISAVRPADGLASLAR